MKYYIANDKNEVEEIELSVLKYRVDCGVTPKDVLICTDENPTWVPYNNAGLIYSPPPTVSREAIIAVIIVIVVFAIVAVGSLWSDAGGSAGASSGVSSFNPIYLVSIISAVAFIIFAWLMFSFRSLLTEIRDLLKAKPEGK